MGNLLGAPVTDKETHIGSTKDGIEFGVSSMQGWRVHMEDAHIAETRLYANETIKQGDGTTKQVKIDLPGHSLFAVFDGHGGTFAAIYAGNNLCRVLSKQPKFVQYAKFIQERAEKEKTLNSSNDRVQYVTAGLELVEGALCDAFIEIDREIASALQGAKHPDADQPYNKEEQQIPSDKQANQPQDGQSSTEEESSTTTMTTDTDDSQGGQGPGPQPMEQDTQSAADSTLQLLEKEGDSGSTACVVLVAPQWVVCANAGDSRAVFSKLGNKPVPLSYDHKPDDEEEERRIRAAGGYVAGGRVEGDLAVSRGLGDFRFKNISILLSGQEDVSTMTTTPTAATTTGAAPDAVSSGNTPEEETMNDVSIDDNSSKQSQLLSQAASQKVSPVPDVIIQNRNSDKDEFIVIACDGIWDVQTNYDCVKTVAEFFDEGEKNMGLVCEELLDICLRQGSKDNMTAIVIKFAAQKVGDGGGVLRRRQLRNSENSQMADDIDDN